MDLDAARIVAELTSRRISMGLPLVVVDATTSTNDDAKRAAHDRAPSGAAFMADAQTSGRGRLGRTWYSPSGENLYASFLVRPAFDTKRAPLVTLASGLAVADALAPLLPAARVTLKWPNDVLVDDRKIAGILTEAHLGDSAFPWIVIGIGINVRTRSFPEAIGQPVTSLAIAGASQLDRSVLFVELASALSHRLRALEIGTASLIEAFTERDGLAGRAISVDGTPATALGIAQDGGLRIRGPDGTESVLLAGDVRLKTTDDPARVL